jgi:precorrin-6B methylase 2
VWLYSLELAGRRVIDVGCGSGILAVAALKLGAAHAVAIDHDPQALLATRENAARNGVADRLTVIGADAPPPERADVAVANILAGTLIDLAPRILAMVRPGGRLALSGILADQADSVAAPYAVPGGVDITPGRSAALGANPHPGRSGFSRDGAVTAATTVGVAPEGAPTSDGADLGWSGFSRDGAVTAATTVGIAPEGAPTSDGADLGETAFPGAILFSPAVLRDGWALLHGIAGSA